MKTNTKQVVAFEQLLSHCTTEGAAYKPGNASISATALKSLLEEAQKSAEAVQHAKNALTNAVNHRQDAFRILPIYGTRIIAALKTAGLQPSFIADVNRIRQRFSYQSSRVDRGSAQNGSPGGQAGQQTAGSAIPSAEPRGPVSMLGYSHKIASMAEMIDLISKNPAYATHQPDLTIEGMHAVLTGLRSSDKEVAMAKNVLYHARQRAKQALYGTSGVYGISVLVKDYFKAANGFRDDKTKAVRKIKFFN